MIRKDESDWVVVEHNHEPIITQELWDKVNYKSDSIRRGYVKMEDIVQALEEEYGIEVGK